MNHLLDIESLILKLVNSVKSNFPSNLAPEDLAKEICKQYNVDIRESTFTDERDGLFDSATKTILINKEVWFQPRRLFTLFHEICHMLIFFEGEEIIETLTSHAKTNYTVVEEELCDLGASEFLIPNKEIENLFQNIDIKAFRHLFEKYPHASAPAIARKLASLYKKEAIFVICCMKEISSENKDCVIEYSFSSTKMQPYRLSRFSRIPNDHFLRMNYEEFSGLNDNGDTTFPFKNIKTWRCYGEYFIENGRLYGILHKKKPIDQSAQSSFF